MRILFSALLLAGFSSMLSAQTPDSTFAVNDTIQHSTDTVGLNKVNLPLTQHVALDSSANIKSSGENEGKHDTISSTGISNLEVAKIDTLAQTDTIVKLSGEKILANIVRDNLNKFYYSFPGETKQVEIGREEINKICYKSGRVVILNMRQANAINIPGWRDVKVVYKADEVGDMDVVADVESYCVAEAGVYQTVKWLARKATIDLQKKTILLHGDCLLITNQVVRRSYGDPTTVRLFGRVYKKK